MKRHIINSILVTLVLTVLLGIVYPLLVTAVAQVIFRDKANGQLLQKNNQTIGSRIIGQPFTGPGYFHSRPSAAGNGYDAANSSGSNLGPTNAQLIARVNDADKTYGSGENVPVDLVTASGSGLDPDISPSAALFQANRVAVERHVPEEDIRQLIHSHIVGRQFGILGEPRVNVLELNLALDEKVAR